MTPAGLDASRPTGSLACACAQPHPRRRVVLTGGPGAGKTALLDALRGSLCEHVRVLPEAASLVFGGGFPRHETGSCREAAQRAIYYVQRELESCADGHNPAIVLCDRGTVDGLAYWPGNPERFWVSVSTTAADELARYDAVIHLRTPDVQHGYNHLNPLRTESPSDAAQIDARIHRAWEAHPRRFEVASSMDFDSKLAHALKILRAELPECCVGHARIAR